MRSTRSNLSFPNGTESAVRQPGQVITLPAMACWLVCCACFVAPLAGQTASDAVGPSDSWIRATSDVAPQFRLASRVAIPPDPLLGAPAAQPLPSAIDALAGLADPSALSSSTVVPVGYEVAVSPEDDPATKASNASARTASSVVALDWDWTPSENTAVNSDLLDKLEASIAESRESAIKEGEDAESNPALKKLNVASERLAQARKQLQKIEERQTEIALAPENKLNLERAQTEELPPLPDKVPPGATMETLSVRLSELQQNEEKIRTELNKVDAKVSERGKILASSSENRQTLQERLENATRIINEQIASPERDEALLVENQAIAISSLLDLRLIAVDKTWADTVENLLATRKDVLKRKLDHAVKTTEKFQELIDRFRQQAAAEEERRARWAAATADPLFQPLAQENSQFAEQIRVLSDVTLKNRDRLNELKGELDELETTRSRLEKHIEKAAFSRSVGILLRHQRGQLPQASTHVTKAEELISEYQKRSLEQLEIQDELDDQDTVREELVSEINQRTENAVDSTSRDDLLKTANEILDNRFKYLTDLSNQYDTLISDIRELRTRHESIVEEIKDLRHYIDQNVLWIRSAEPLGADDLNRSLEAVRSIGQTSQWQSLASLLGTQVWEQWPVYLLLVVGLGLAIGMRHQLTRRLRLICRQKSDVRFSPLVRSLILTVLQGSFLPILLVAVGWLLRDPGDPSSLNEAISQGLMAVALQYFMGSVLYRLCTRDGVAETQLQWSREAAQLIRSAVGRIMRYCLPLTGMTYALETYDNGRWGDSLGRILFIAAMLVFSWTSLMLLRGLRRTWRAHPTTASSVWVQAFGLWAPLVFVAPLALVVVSALGYQYSAVFLEGRVLLTWWALLGIASLYHIVRRLVTIGNNRIQQHRRFYETIPEVSEEGSEEKEIARYSLEVHQQVNRLLYISAVAAFIVVAVALWAEVIPAISAMDIRIWGPIEAQVAVELPDGSTEMRTEQQWITMNNLVVALLILAATLVVTRNLPGLLEMLLLNRLPLDRGGKYAISIIGSYIVGAIGVIIAAQTIGISWQSVQWLVAAMGLGLGFGLQEIVSNFISGVVILLERPVRVGDCVTINNVTGIVTRIQIRATTVMDWDRRELIVPNRKLVTEEVINWTLTDVITRVVIPVGIAYGSDTRQAYRSLMKVARDNRRVLRDPPAQVIFKAFGNSTLDFELRVHIANREHYLDMVHELHMAVDDEFRRQKIEIAFPQQDVHLKGLEGIFRGPHVSPVEVAQANGNPAD